MYQDCYKLVQCIKECIYLTLVIISYYINFISMSTIVNPFKVNKFSNTIHSRNKSTTILDTTILTQTIKLPALRAINKSVKHNNISFATSKDLNKLRQQPQQVQNIEQLSAHQSLYLIRKKFDSIYKEKQELQKQIDVITIKRDKIKAQKLKYQTQRKQGDIKVLQLGQNVVLSKLHSDQADIEKKVMLHIIDRLKDDKIIYDMRKFKYEKQLKYLKKQKEIIIKQKGQKINQGDRIKKVFQKLIHHFDEEKKERQEHLKNFNDIIDNKESVYEHEEERHADILIVRQNAMQDKLPTEKNWYKLMLVTKFVSKFLKDKINRQMSKFMTVQNAFKNIKTETGIQNTKTLIQKFISKQATYGEYLGKISINEKHITQLKEQQQRLRKQRQILQNQQDIISSNKKKILNLNKQLKQLQQYQQKAINCFMLTQKIKHITQKYSKQISKISNIKSQHHKNDNLAQKFKNILQNITIIFQQINDTQINDKFNQTDLKANNNIRIFFQQEPQNLINDNNHRKSQVYEEDYINSQRQVVLRNNDKFMKELKKKYDDIKKLQMDAQPKKKEVVIEKPKPVQIKEQ